MRSRWGRDKLHIIHNDAAEFMGTLEFFPPVCNITQITRNRVVNPYGTIFNILFAKQINLCFYTVQGVIISAMECVKAADKTVF